MILMISLKLTEMMALFVGTPAGLPDIRAARRAASTFRNDEVKAQRRR